MPKVEPGGMKNQQTYAEAEMLSRSREYPANDKRAAEVSFGRPLSESLKRRSYAFGCQLSAGTVAKPSR